MKTSSSTSYCLANIGSTPATLPRKRSSPVKRTWALRSLDQPVRITNGKRAIPLASIPVTLLLIGRTSRRSVQQAIPVTAGRLPWIVNILKRSKSNFPNETVDSAQVRSNVPPPLHHAAPSLFVRRSNILPCNTPANERGAQLVLLPIPCAMALKGQFHKESVPSVCVAPATSVVRRLICKWLPLQLL